MTADEVLDAFPRVTSQDIRELECGKVEWMQVTSCEEDGEYVYYLYYDYESGMFNAIYA